MSEAEMLRKSHTCEYEEPDVGKLYDDWQAREAKAMDRAEKQTLAGLAID